MAERIEKKVGKALVSRRLTLAVAESCTGGLLGHMLTLVPGSSRYFLGGVVAYSNRAKTEILGVRKKTLGRYGAVSSQTAVQMARGALKLFHADIALSITGIAGPSGGTKKKPVGLVFIGLCGRDESISRRLVLSGTRAQIKKLAARKALEFLKDNL